jgi:hypothetical protein
LNHFSRIAVFLLITAGIIGYLKTGVGLFEQVKTSGLRIQLNSIDRALVMSRQQRRHYPRDFGSFIRSQFGKEGGQDPSKDPWGSYYSFKKTSTGFDLSSAGADGQFATDDDVVWRRDGKTAGIVKEKASLPKRSVSTAAVGDTSDDPLLARLESMLEDRVKTMETYNEKELNQILSTLLEQNWFE